MLDHAYALGVRTWDTAEMYPVPQTEATSGRSEEILGRWLQIRQHSRAEHAIVTKVAGPGNMAWIRDGPAALDGNNIITATEGSLRRLSCDYVDCLLLHWPDRCAAASPRHQRFPATCFPRQRHLPIADPLLLRKHGRALGRLCAVGKAPCPNSPSSRGSNKPIRHGLAHPPPQPACTGPMDAACHHRKQPADAVQLLIVPLATTAM